MGSIIFRNVSFAYGKEVIFENLSLTLPSHGLLLFLGKSGSGKTTFLSLLSGTLKPTAGTIEYRFRKRPSPVYQSPLLLDYLSVLDNVALPLLLSGMRRKKAEEKARASLAEVALSGMEEKAPYLLSGGEQMRAAIARALVSSSPVLVLDEPTGQLDEKNSLSIYALLRKLSASHLILLVTHDERNALTLADRLYELRDHTLFLRKERPLEESGEEKEDAAREKGLREEESLFLTLRFLRRRKKRVFLSSFFLAFLLSLCYLGIGLKSHLPETFQSLFSAHYESEAVSVSQKEKIATVGHLTLYRYQVPEEEVLSSLSEKASYPSLRYFLPEGEEITLHQKTATVSFLPVFEEDRTKLRKGEGLSASGIVVNSLFLSEFALSEEEALGKKVSFSHTALVHVSTLEKSDLLSLDYSFTVKGISNELPAFSKVIAYYSYSDLKERLAKTRLPEISKERDQETSAYDLLIDPLFSKEDVTSGERILLADDEKKLKEKGEALYPGRIRLTSSILEIEESTASVFDSLSQVLTVFLGLTLLSAFLLEFLSVYSLYEENLRLFALAKCRDEGKRNLRTLALAMALIFLFLTLFLFFGMSQGLSYSLDRFLLLRSYPAFFPLGDSRSFVLVILIALSVSLPAALLPLLKVSDKEIQKELEGED